MIETEILKQIAEAGYSYAVPLLLFVGVHKLWRDMWPWWREVYWPSRETRWQEMHNAQVERDKQYEKMTKEFLETIRRYEDGHQAKSNQEHEAIIREIRDMGNTFADLFQSVMGEITNWRKDTTHLLAMSEQRMDMVEKLFKTEAVSQ